MAPSIPFPAFDATFSRFLGLWQGGEIGLASLRRSFGLFFMPAIAELAGCYLPLLWLTGKGAAWLLLPAALSLAAFVRLLTLHLAASGRVYATYGAIYTATALAWLRLVDGATPRWNDWLGVALALTGAAVIAMGRWG